MASFDSCETEYMKLDSRPARSSNVTTASTATATANVSATATATATATVTATATATTLYATATTTHYGRLQPSEHDERSSVEPSTYVDETRSLASTWSFGVMASSPRVLSPPGAADPLAGGCRNVLNSATLQTFQSATGQAFASTIGEHRSGMNTMAEQSDDERLDTRDSVNLRSMLDSSMFPTSTPQESMSGMRGILRIINTSDNISQPREEFDSVSLSSMSSIRSDVTNTPRYPPSVYSEQSITQSTESRNHEPEITNQNHGVPVCSPSRSALTSSLDTDDNDTDACSCSNGLISSPDTEDNYAEKTSSVASTPSSASSTMSNPMESIVTSGAQGLSGASHRTSQALTTVQSSLAQAAGTQLPPNFQFNAHVPFGMPPSNFGQKFVNDTAKTVFESLMTHLNSGQFKTFNEVTLTFQPQMEKDADVYFVVRYLQSCSHMYQNQLDECLDAITDAWNTVDQTSSPNKFKVDILAIKSWLQLKRSRLDHVDEVIQGALQIYYQDRAASSGKVTGWIQIQDARLDQTKMRGRPSDQQLRKDAISSLQFALKQFEVEINEGIVNEGIYGYTFAAIKLVSILLHCDEGMKLPRTPITKEEHIQVLEILVRILASNQSNLDMHGTNLRVALADYIMTFGSLENAQSYVMDALEKPHDPEAKVYCQARFDYLVKAIHQNLAPQETPFKEQLYHFEDLTEQKCLDFRRVLMAILRHLKYDIPFEQTSSQSKDYKFMWDNCVIPGTSIRDNKCAYDLQCSAKGPNHDESAKASQAVGGKEDTQQWAPQEQVPATNSQTGYMERDVPQVGQTRDTNPTQATQPPWVPGQSQSLPSVPLTSVTYSTQPKQFSSAEYSSLSLHSDAYLQQVGSSVPVVSQYQQTQPQSTVPKYQQQDTPPVYAQLSDYFEQVSLKTEQIPPTTQQVPPTTQQVPPTTQQVPPTTQQVPLTTKQIPLATQQVPMTTQQVPLTTQQVPLTTQQVPLTTQQVPLTTQQVPLTTQQVPMTTQQVPMTTQQVPMTTQQIPPQQQQVPPQQQQVPWTTQQQQVPYQYEQIPTQQHQVPAQQQQVPPQQQQVPPQQQQVPPQQYTNDHYQSQFSLPSHQMAQTPQYSGQPNGLSSNLTYPTNAVSHIPDSGSGYYAPTQPYQPNAYPVQPQNDPNNPVYFPNPPFDPSFGNPAEQHQFQPSQYAPMSSQQQLPPQYPPSLSQSMLGHQYAQGPPSYPSTDHSVNNFVIAESSFVSNSFERLTSGEKQNGVGNLNLREDDRINSGQSNLIPKTNTPQAMAPILPASSQNSHLLQLTGPYSSYSDLGATSNAYPENKAYTQQGDLTAQTSSTQSYPVHYPPVQNPPIATWTVSSCYPDSRPHDVQNTHTASSQAAAPHACSIPMSSTHVAPTQPSQQNQVTTYAQSGQVQTQLQPNPVQAKPIEAQPPYFNQAQQQQTWPTQPHQFHQLHYNQMQTPQPNQAQPYHNQQPYYNQIPVPQANQIQQANYNQTLQPYPNETHFNQTPPYSADTQQSHLSQPQPLPNQGQQPQMTNNPWYPTPITQPTVSASQLHPFTTAPYSQFNPVTTAPGSQHNQLPTLASQGTHHFPQPQSSHPTAHQPNLNPPYTTAPSTYVPQSQTSLNSSSGHAGLPTTGQPYNYPLEPL